MKNRQLILCCLALFIFNLFFISMAEAGRGKTIGVSLLTLANPFFKEMGDAIKGEAKKNGYEVIIVSGDLDPARQREQIKDFIARKVDAILLTPCDSKAIGSPIKDANQAGIPVFTADIASMDKEAKVVSHIATNNYEGGRQAAKAMMIALQGKVDPKVVVIGHPEVESVILREKGFRDEIRDAKSNIRIIGSWPGGGDKAKSFTVTQEILQSHPDLAGFFCINDPTALGATAAIEIAKKTGQIIVVGFDGQPEGKKAIKEGKIFADPIQFPDEIGRQSVQNIVKYFYGEKVPPQLLIPTKLYLKADAEKELK